MVKQHILKHGITLCGKKSSDFPKAEMILRRNMNTFIMTEDEKNAIHKICWNNIRGNENVKEEKYSREKKQQKEIKKWLLNDEHTPTKIYEKGRIGNLVISKVFENGLYYYSFKEGYLRWYEVYRLFDVTKLNKTNKKIGRENKFMRNRTYNRSFEQIIWSFEQGDLKLNPTYQREKIWTLEDKQSLIRSILNDIPIGRFALRDMPYPHLNDTCEEYEKRKHMSCAHWDYYYHYEIVDGKQRFSAIYDFRHDKFQIDGLYFRDLHIDDRLKMNDLHVPVVEARYDTEKEILEWFIALNTMGKPQNPEHLEKIKQQFKEIDK